MSTKKAISTSFVAIFILIITQIIAQSIASMFVIIKIPTGICNITATETAEGAKHKECTVCKKVLETATIPATGSSDTPQLWRIRWNDIYGRKFNIPDYIN